MLTSLLLLRSSRPEVFCKKGVLRNFAKFTGKQVFSCEFWEISKNSFSCRTPPVAASVLLYITSATTFSSIKIPHYSYNSFVAAKRFDEILNIFTPILTETRLRTYALLIYLVILLQ